MGNNNYSLRLYDDELLRFSLKENGLEGLHAEILSYNKEMKHLLPLGLEFSGEGIVRWLRRRTIPKNRTFVNEILGSLGLSVNDTKGIIDVCKGLSLNDSYWVVPAGFTGKFSEYNLYENRFSEALSLVAYTGAGYGDEVFSTSPELTTNGALPKAWRFIPGQGVFLYKGGSTGASNAGREAFCEHYASQVAECMGLNSVHYDLENWKGITASKCALFTNIDVSYVPVGELLAHGSLAECLRLYDSLGGSFGEELRSMLVFDALIYNEDRHFGNFGVLRDNRSGNIIAPAPIFDNGLSLLCFAGREALKSEENLEKYARTRSNPYGISFEDVCAEVIGHTQKEQLRRMIGFRFTRHPSINLPDEHLDALERLLQKRTRELLSLPAVNVRRTEKEDGLRGYQIYASSKVAKAEKGEER